MWKLTCPAPTGLNLNATPLNLIIILWPTLCWTLYYFVPKPNPDVSLPNLNQRALFTLVLAAILVPLQETAAVILVPDVETSGISTKACLCACRHEGFGLEERYAFIHRKRGNLDEIKLKTWCFNIWTQTLNTVTSFNTSITKAATLSETYWQNNL